MEKNYDDGLVHSHNWASEPEIPSGVIKPQGPETTAASQEHGDFDDGLVHAHDWARN